jgi:hypothetical protein
MGVSVSGRDITVWSFHIENRLHWVNGADLLPPSRHHKLAMREPHSADRMSRHYYDMAQLIGHEAESRALANLDLLEQVAHHKSVFFKAAWASYDDAKPGTLTLPPNPELAKALRRDYVGMQEMIIGGVPKFDDILGAVEAIEAKVNG